MPTFIALGLGENLAETLDIGNYTTDGQVIKSQNGGSEINLRAFGTNNIFYITNDNGTFLKAFLYADDTEIGIGFGSKFAVSVQPDNANMLVIGGTSPVAMITAKEIGIFEDASIQRPTGASFILVDIVAAGYTLLAPVSQALFLNSGSLINATTFLAGVTNSIAAGGEGLTVKTNNSTYVNQISFQESGILFDLILKSGTVTADRLLTLPDKSGELVVDTYAEKWTSYAATLNSTWETIVITDALPNSIVEIICENNVAAVRDMGVRQVGSGLSRFVTAVTRSSTSFTVRTDSSKQVQFYASAFSDISFHFSAQL